MDKGEIGNRGVLMKKTFNLDGPNGSQCYWRDLRKEKQLFLKRPFEGRSVLAWEDFSASGKADLERW